MRHRVLRRRNLQRVEKFDCSSEDKKLKKVENSSLMNYVYEISTRQTDKRTFFPIERVTDCCRKGERLLFGDGGESEREGVSSSVLLRSERLLLLAHCPE